MTIETHPMPYGFTAIWSKNSKAARYLVHLQIAYGTNYSTLETIEINRDKRYYSFTNLARLSTNIKRFYSVRVDAEDREGNILESATELALIQYFANGMHSMVCRTEEQ